MSSCSVLNIKTSEPVVVVEPNRQGDYPKKDTIIEEVVVSEPSIDEEDSDHPPKNQLSNRLMKVALILPFESHANEIKGSHAFVLHFNEGIKRAMRSLKITNNPIDITIYDSRSNYSNLESLLNSLENNTDMIIGGFSKSNIVKIAEFALRNKIGYISPIYPSNSIVKNNPYHIQINPSFDSHCEKILADVIKNYPQANHKFIARQNTTEVNRVEKMIDLYNKQMGIKQDSTDNQILIKWENENSIFNFIGKIKPYQTNVFIIPSWSDQSYVYSILRQISIDKGKGEVVIYGMPQWKGFDLESFNYFENLQLHISSGASINNPTTHKNLQRELRDIFNNVATDKQILAYASGYDVGKYFGELLSEHGLHMMDNLYSKNKTGLAIDFLLEKIGEEEKILVSNKTTIDRIENKAVKMLVFENWKFNLR